MLAHIILIPSFYFTGMSKIVITKYVVPDEHSACREANMNSSHLSPFVFTKTLIPLMMKTACLPGTDVRIVNVC